MPRELSDHQVDHIDCRGPALIIEHRVIERERPPQQRVAAAQQAEHDELSGADRRREAGRDKTEAKRVACQANIGADRDGLLEKTWIHVGLAELPKSRQKNQPRMARKTPIRANKNS